MKEYKYLLYGIATTILLVLLILFSNKDSTNDFRVKYNSYKISFANILGLENNSGVYVNGYRVGYVSLLDFNKYLQPVVTIKVDSKYKIPADSTAKLEHIGITSKLRINVTPGFAEAMEDGDWFDYATEAMTLEKVIHLAEIKLDNKNKLLNKLKSTKIGED